ncbi:MAG: hypothetical protein Q9163_003477 [Psora crenata]
MNTIREIQNLNKRELENAVPPEASWHTDYRSTAYIHISGLPFTLTEGDILTIFSQFGEPTYLHLARDKESGKSKGFAWLKYEDQRSTDLAVDNLGGSTVMGRVLKVDHAYYKKKEGEDDEERMRRELRGDADGGEQDRADSEVEEMPTLKEEVELAKLIREHDDDDPMKEYLVQQKREEVAKALQKLQKGEKRERRRKHRHHHRHPGKKGGGDEEESGDRTEHKHHRRRRSRSP